MKFDFIIIALLIVFQTNATSTTTQGSIDGQIKPTMHVLLQRAKTEDKHWNGIIENVQLSLLSGSTIEKVIKLVDETLTKNNKILEDLKTQKTTQVEINEGQINKIFKNLEAKKQLKFTTEEDIRTTKAEIVTYKNNIVVQTKQQKDLQERIKMLRETRQNDIENYNDRKERDTSASEALDTILLDLQESAKKQKYAAIINKLQTIDDSIEANIIDDSKSNIESKSKYEEMLKNAQNLLVRVTGKLKNNKKLLSQAEIKQLALEEQLEDIIEDIKQMQGFYDLLVQQKAQLIKRFDTRITEMQTTVDALQRARQLLVGKDGEIQRDIQAKQEKLAPSHTNYEYFFAKVKESCTEACKQRNQTCSSSGINAIKEVKACKQKINELGKFPEKGGQYKDDNTGCTYNPNQTGWFQVMRKDSDPQCDAVNPGNSRYRVCSCE